MGSKDDLQPQSIQLNVLDPTDPNFNPRLVEWAKQTSAKLKELQQQIDMLNEWVFPE